MSQATIIRALGIIALHVLLGAAVVPAVAAEFRIVSQQSLKDADITTHEISSGSAILGVSEFGGGYINKLVVPGVGDIMGPVAARYGRGGQVAIRDRLHGGRYNPTQAGFTDTAGTNVQLEQSTTGRIYMPPRPVALWHGDRKYDFTEWEDLAADPYPKDGGNSDSDGMDESGLPGKQATEITSEFDFTGAYEDVRDGSKVRIPAFRFSFEFRFIREPGHALRQFRRGTAAYQPVHEVADRSNLAPPGDHPSSEDSLTGVVLASALRGDKAIWDPEAVFFLDASGRLVGQKQAGNFRLEFARDAQLIRSPLVIVSRSTDPAQGPAIGYFHPHNRVNQFSVVGRSIKDHAAVYEDNRVTTAALAANFRRTPHLWRFGIVMQLTGLLSRKETPAGVYEAIRGESYFLIGTPNEIVEAARAIHRFP